MYCIFLYLIFVFLYFYFINNYQFGFQVESLHKIIELSLFVKKLNDFLLKMNPDEQEYPFLFESSLVVCFSLLERSVHYGHNPFELVQLIMQLCSTLPKACDLQLLFLINSFILKITFIQF